MNTSIQFSMDNHERHNKRLDSLEASMKRFEAQVGQIAEQLQGHQKGKLLSQLEQAITITIHEGSKGNNNGVEEIPTDNMPLQTEIKGEDMEEKKDIIVPTPSESNKEREPLPLPSLHKAANPYKPPIPLTCHPKAADNDKKPLKLKDPGSFMVNISIGVRR